MGDRSENSGFTFIETIVSTAIFVMLLSLTSSFLFASQNNSSTEHDCFYLAEKLQLDMKSLSSEPDLISEDPSETTIKLTLSNDSGLRTLSWIHNINTATVRRVSPDNQVDIYKGISGFRIAVVKSSESRLYSARIETEKNHLSLLIHPGPLSSFDKARGWWVPGHYNFSGNQHP